MQIVSIVFSPTGGTQKIVSLLSEGLRLKCEVVEASLIDLAEPAPELSPEIQADDLVMIAMPSFGGRAPAVAIERLSRLNGHGAKTVIVCVYGSRAYEDTLVEMQDAAREANFDVFAAVSAVSRHSMLPTLASKRPDVWDEDMMEQFAEKIADKWKRGALPALLELPGNRPYKVWNGAIVPYATDACMHCGICAENCPTQAIAVDQPCVVNKEACAFCMRCVRFCPIGARMIDPNTVATLTERLRPMCDPDRENELFL